MAAAAGIEIEFIRTRSIRKEDRAQELLAQTRLDMERIAERSGFASSRQLRRAWLGPEDVLNTLGAVDFLAALRPRA